MNVLDRGEQTGSEEEDAEARRKLRPPEPCRHMCYAPGAGVRARRSIYEETGLDDRSSVLLKGLSYFAKHT